MGWFPQQPGGLNRYFFDLIRTLQADNTAVQGLVAGSDNGSLPFQSQGLPVRPFAASQSSLPWRWFRMVRCFKQELPRTDPQVVVSHFALYAFPVRRRLRNLPHVVHFHGPWAAEEIAEGGRGAANRIKHWIEKRVYATGDRLITLSEAFARVLVEQYGIDEQRIRVIPGGIDATRFDCGLSVEDARRRLGWPTDRPIVLCVRRLARRMGLANLIAAAAQLRSQHPDLLVLIAGKGGLENELRSQIDAAGLAEHVRLLGFVPDTDLPLAYRAADISVVPTQALEGFGLITLESLAAGTPCLVTPVGGLPEAVCALDEKLVLPGTGITDIAAGISQALTGAKPMPSADQCRRYVREHFDWPIIAQRVLAVYQEAIEAFHSR